MKKNLYFLPLGALIFLFTSCQTAPTQCEPNSPVSELSPQNLVVLPNASCEITPRMIEAIGSPVLRLDASHEVISPKRFRTTYSDFNPNPDLPPPPTEITRRGLDTLNISGSGQFSKPGFQEIMREIRTKSNAPVYVFDLRQESHGFLNDTAVSWFKTQNWMNITYDKETVIREEQALLSQCLNQTLTAYDIKNSDPSSHRVLNVNEIMTEETFVQELGAHYIRYTCTDHIWPDAQWIDQFLQFYQTLPQERWLHFHCSGGSGRTVVFMSLVDMIENPDLSLEEITYRQALLGGSYLLDDLEKEWSDHFSLQKRLMVKLLYKYVQENRFTHFAQSWSEFLLKQ